MQHVHTRHKSLSEPVRKKRQRYLQRQGEPKDKRWSYGTLFQGQQASQNMDHPR